MVNAISALLALLAVSPALAHQGHDIEHEIAARSAYLKNAPRDLSHCAEKMQERGIEKRALERRAQKIKTLRNEVALKKRALNKRQAPSGTPTGGLGGAPTGGLGGGGADAGGSLSDWGESVVNASHQYNMSISASTPGVEEIIFANSSCVLNPEGETGPFYVQGEFIRSDIAEDQEGVAVTIDGQFIDSNTCEVIEDLYWDVWHCNSTGVYAGVLGNGNGNDADESNLNNTFLRGLQPTDSDGVAQFSTIFPGHYAGRTTHIHIVSHMNATVMDNGTLTAGNITHVGQFFFDQDLIDSVNDEVAPYNTNTIDIVENADDRVFSTEASDGSDPVFDYVLLGDDVADGLFAWITIGVDPEARYTADPAAIYAAGGGYETGSDGM